MCERLITMKTIIGRMYSHLKDLLSGVTLPVTNITRGLSYV
jgi:hypothetical protein